MNQDPQALHGHYMYIMCRDISSQHIREFFLELVYIGTRRITQIAPCTSLVLAPKIQCYILSRSDGDKVTCTK